MPVLARKLEVGPEIAEIENPGSEAKTFEAFLRTKGEFHAHEILLECAATVFPTTAESWHSGGISMNSCVKVYLTAKGLPPKDF